MKRSENVTKTVTITYSDEEVTCPVCESYSVIEYMKECRCSGCGQSWVSSLKG